MTIQLVEAPPGRVVRPIETPAVPFETRTEPTALRVRGVGKSFGATQVLREIDFDVARGEFVALLGPSGCGKTTLLRIIAGLETPTQGRTFLNGADATAWTPGARRCGIVFQSYALFPTLTALANVEFAVDRRRHARRARHALAMESLALVGLADAAKKRPSQLSGGQQQRVALARALASEPQLLLLDEPLSALDAKVREHLRGEIRRIQRTLNLATILVTHDQEEAMAMADRVAVMRDGRIVQTAPPRAIYQQPAAPFVAEFIGTMNFLSGWKVRNEREVWRDGGIFRTAAPIAAPVGSVVRLGFRPEDVRVHSGGSHEGDNRLAATLDRREFRGATWRLYFRPDDSLAPRSEPPGLIAVDAPDGDATRCSAESQMLYIAPERVHVFVEPRGDAA